MPENRSVAGLLTVLLRVLLTAKALFLANRPIAGSIYTLFNSEVQGFDRAMRAHLSMALYRDRTFIPEIRSSFILNGALFGACHCYCMAIIHKVGEVAQNWCPISSGTSPPWPYGRPLKLQSVPFASWAWKIRASSAEWRPNCMGAIENHM